MSEAELRKQLAEIDRLRADAKVCTKMHSHWMYHDGELVEVKTITVRRRWRTGETHSERVMPPVERELFTTWLYERAQQLNADADALAAALTPKETP
jgi:hypothetical protein